MVVVTTITRLRHKFWSQIKMAETVKFRVRSAVADDIRFASDFSILIGWRFGPHDIGCAFEFDPSGHFVGELDKKVI